VAHGRRLELLDVLIHGDRTVEALARATGLQVASASQHLQPLLRAGVVTRRAAGKHAVRLDAVSFTYQGASPH
jgi:DNA-binding transcriptional ArsR family regulator